MKIILGKMIFFPCLVAFWKIFYSVVRKIEQKERGDEACILENDLRKNWV
jgi:hypothetical protein